MADIRLSAGDDVYDQPEADKNLFNNVYGEDGNDTIRMYQGTAIGGKGNDRFEKLVDATNPNRDFQIAYWTAGDNLKVNLAEGWAEDGQGGRDTLVGVRSIHGSGSKNAWVQGDAQDNYYWPNGGDDTFLGGAGNDTISINSQFQPSPGAPFRNALLGELDIKVAADGSSATVKPKFGTTLFSIAVADVEGFDAQVDAATNTWQRLRFVDFITPQSMAESAIAAGGSMRWNATQPLGSAVVITFSFVTAAPSAGIGATGFRAFDEAERQIVRDILARTAQITQATFIEVTETAGVTGQLRLGISQQATTKGQAYLPGTNDEQAGDIWMDVESMAAVASGSEGYQALLHEIGHGLGLRHPRNVDAGDAWSMQLLAQDDRISLSVMSQARSSDGLFRADWGPLDVLALRYLYGMRAASTGDSNYVLGSRESAAMTTIVDDGGTDTLDASTLPSGVNLDLVPGHTGSAGITPAGFSGVDNLGISSGTWIENAIGSAFDDVLLGNDLANRLTGGPGNDWIDGGPGIDIAAFVGKRTDYELSSAFGKLFVRARDGLAGFDTLIGIERLEFADQTLELSSRILSADSNHTLDEDARLTAVLPDPSDVARGSVTYRLVAGGAHGSASVTSNGQLNYVPRPDFWGTDAVVYEIGSAAAGGGSNRYVGFIQVQPVNDGPPVSRAGAFLVPGSNSVMGRLPAASDADGDPITYALATDSKNGEVLVNGSGTFTYKSKAGFAGSDSFSFIVGDGSGGTNVYNVAMTVVDVAALREGTAAGDTMAVQPGADGYLGFGGNDRITGGGGNDLIDGGDGLDTAVYLSGKLVYQLARTPYGWTVNANLGAEGKDMLTGIERLQFSDTAVALDLDGNAGAVAQIIRAVFGSSYLDNRIFVGIGLQLFDGGMSYADVVKLAVGTDLFAQLAGGRSNTAFVNFVYRNVVGVAPSAGELAEFTGLLQAGVYTQDSLALLAAQVPLNTASAELVGLAGVGIEFVPAA